MLTAITAEEDSDSKLGQKGPKSPTRFHEEAIELEG
jgi:hypothetical protein